MIINISGKQTDIDTELQTYIKDKLENNIKKYSDHPISANVHFSTDASYLFKCEIIINLGNGALKNAEAEDKEKLHAFNLTFTKIEAQLRKYQNRAKDHHHEDKENIQNRTNTDPIIEEEIENDNY